MADISVIQLPSGSSYNIKDAWARQAIEGLGNPTHFNSFFRSFKYSYY